MPPNPISPEILGSGIFSAEILARLAELRERQQIPTVFSKAALAEAEAAASAALPRATDMRDLPFVTIDPETSTDLDQAMHLSRTESGYRVRYAIADVPHFVALGSALAKDAEKRGQTLYLPDDRISLHPKAISEGVGSLLPGEDRPAFVWIIDLDDRGRSTGVAIERAIVRSRAKLSYSQVQHDLDAGSAHASCALLPEIGKLRRDVEASRGGASLNVPEQNVETTADGYELEWRIPNLVEGDNAQISLLTGMCAGQIMLQGRVGILRTMPAAQADAVARFKRQAQALGAPWPQEADYGSFLRSLNWREPRHLALLSQATTLFRGAGYTAFDGDIPENVIQSAIAAPYAHVTAPLRRLVDRYCLLVCYHLARGEEVPPALRAALPGVPELMNASNARAGKIERDSLSLIEAAVMAGHIGKVFRGTVIDVREAGGNGNAQSPGRSEVQFSDPPVVEWVPGVFGLGTTIDVKVLAADVSTSEIVVEAV